MWDLCCLGDINFDVIVYPYKHTPEEDEQIVDTIFLERGGSATNCACVASALGLGTALVCKLPPGELGDWLRRKVETHGVDIKSAKSERNGLTKSPRGRKSFHFAMTIIRLRLSRNMSLKSFVIKPTARQS